jgi:hypothetical protein
MLDATTNLTKVTPVGTYGASDTAIELSTLDAAKLPAAPFNATWFQASVYPDPSDDPNAEIVRVTAVNLSNGVITVTRGAEGPNAASTKNGAGTYKMIVGITEKMISDIGNNLRLPWNAPQAVSGTINGSNRTFTIPITPGDPNSIQLTLARQPQILGVDFTISGTTITYTTAPDASLSGQPHYASYQ